VDERKSQFDQEDFDNGGGDIAPVLTGHQHSKEIDRNASKLVASVAASIKYAEEMMKAIDKKCLDCEPMRNRKKKFEVMLHRMRDLLDPAEHHVALIAKAWSEAKEQVDK